MSTWMILWFATLMTLSFSQRTWDHEHHVHLVLEKLQELDFMQIGKM
jgi:hypothetical protein